MKAAIQNSGNQPAPCCSLYENGQREQTTIPQTRMGSEFLESVPSVPCVPLGNRRTQEKARDAANQDQRPADLMAALDKHYGLTEAGDYQFVFDDIYARKDMWEWATKEANRLIQGLINNKDYR